MERNKNLLKFIISIFAFFIFINTLLAFPDSGLVAYYPFNGNANDESGNNNHGTVYGATLTTDRNANTDKAYSFDGNDYISVADDPSIRMDSAFTISLWFYAIANGSGSGGILINKEGEYEIARFPDGTIRLGIANTDPNWIPVWRNTNYVTT